MANLRLVTPAVCLALITFAAVYVGHDQYSRTDDLVARESRNATPCSPRKNPSHSHHDTTVEDPTHDLPNARPNSFDSDPLSSAGGRVVEPLGRKQSPEKEKYAKSAHHDFNWTPGGHERKDRYTPVGNAPRSSSPPSHGPSPYTAGINFDGRNVTKPGSLGGHRMKRATGPIQCTADVQCAPTECCLEDQLGANPLSLVCVPRQNNGYCGRPKACRYTQNCKPPAERCVLTRVIFHPRYWNVPIGYCATL